MPVVVVAGGGSVACSQSQSHRPSSLRDRRQTKELIIITTCAMYIHHITSRTYTTDVVCYLKATFNSGY